jgi:hypothetical protein
MGLVISKGLTLKSYNTPAAIAGVAPTLDYRFALDRREIEAISLTDKLTYTGATNGTFVNRAGLIERATTDQPRFDHGPVSRQSLGLLVEEQRTNSIRNNTMVGAVAGTPGTLPTNWSISGGGFGTLTQEVVATGTSNGIAYIDVKYSGTSSNTGFRIFCEVVGQIVASTGQAWTGSVYAAILPGSSGLTSVNVAINERNSGSSIINIQSGSSYSTLSSTMTRLTTTITSASATTVSVQPEVNIVFPTTTAVDFTLRIGLPQLEQGAFATSTIPTTTTALTRPVDSAVIDGTGVITGTYTLVEKPAGCAVVNGTNIDLVSGFTAERVMVFPAALSAPQITAIRGAM